MCPGTMSMQVHATALISSSELPSLLLPIDAPEVPCMHAQYTKPNSMCKTSDEKKQFAMHLTAESFASALTYVRMRVFLFSSLRYDTRHQNRSDSVLPEMRAVSYEAAVRAAVCPHPSLARLSVIGFDLCWSAAPRA